METKYKIIIFLLPLFGLLACDDDILDKLPETSLAETNTFSTNNSVRAYAWQFYERFQAHNQTFEISGSSHPSANVFGLNAEADADLIQNGVLTNGSAYIWNRMVIPGESEASWNTPYRYIRSANLLLKNVPDSDLDDVDKDHWISVGLFFKSFEYFNLLQMYGGVPWLETAITEQDTLILNGGRSTRDEVAANILRDLTWAEEHIKASVVSEKREVDASVVNALISRFGLFEGTWRKYHGLSDANTYLEASVAASEKLLADADFSLHPNFDELHNNESLKGVSGIILFKEYDNLENFSNMSTTFRASNSTWDITRKGVDKFLCTDGQTRWNSPLFQGDTDAFAEFRNRDRRLYYMTPAPYRVDRLTNTTWQSTGNAADEEYFSVYESISDEDHKTLPDLNWFGNVVPAVPNFTQLGVTPYNRTFSGYRVWRHYNQSNTGASSRDGADAPIFRMGEVMVNHAEAMFELGRFDQSVADVTINELRARGGVASMTVATIDAAFDPTRDPSVDPVLFEIRRERAVELMAEGFRREDLRRWKKMDYATEVKLGRWITAASVSNEVPIQGDAASGYVQLVPGTPPSFPEHYYLFPLPADQIVLTSMEQNPSW